MGASTNPLGPALLSGSGSALWAARAAPVRALMAALYGPQAATARTMPARREGRGLRVAPAAMQTLKGYMEHLAQALTAPARIHMLLTNPTWVLWPEGPAAPYESMSLRRALAGRGARGAPPVQLTSYEPLGRAEFLALLPRAIGPAIVETLNADVFVHTTLSRDGHGHRCLWGMSLDRFGRWRATSLPLPAVDDIGRRALPPGKAEHPAVDLATRFARHYLLGHSRQMAALAGDIADPIVFGTAQVPRDEWPAELVAASNPLAASGDGLLGAERVRGDGAVPAHILSHWRAGAEAAFRRPWVALARDIVRVSIGRAEDLSGALAPSRDLWVLIVSADQAEAGRDRKRPHVAAVYDPDAPDPDPEPKIAAPAGAAGAAPRGPGRRSGL